MRGDSLMAAPKFPPGGTPGRHFNSNFSYLDASGDADFALVGSLRGEWTVSHFKSVCSHPVNRHCFSHIVAGVYILVFAK